MVRKIIIITLAILQATGTLKAQKQTLSHYTSAEWPAIQSTGISNDGRFVKYSIQVPEKKATFIVVANDLSWKKELPGVSNGIFTNDSRRITFMNSGDSLGIWELGTDSVRYITQVASYSVPEDGDGRYIIYQKEDSDRTLVLLNLTTSEARQFTNIHGYIFNKRGEVLLLEAAADKDSISKDDVLWFDIASSKIETLCHSCLASQFTFDEEGKRLAFFSKKQIDSKSTMSVRYYKAGMDSAEIIADPSSPGMAGMLIRDDGITFNKHGDRIFFKIEHSNERKGISTTANTGAQVSVQGPHDVELKALLAPGPFMVTVNLNSPEMGVIRLQRETDKGGTYYIDDNGNWIVTESNIIGDINDVKWNKLVRPDIYLVSTRDGSRRLLKNRLRYYNMLFSPTGNYLVWFDQEQKQWFSYNIVQGITKNITKGIKEPVYLENDFPDLPRAQNIAAWMESDKGALIYDGYDIWQVDLNAAKAPINITHGLGAKNKIRFQYVKFGKDLSSTVGFGDTLLLSAFDLQTKQDGFFSLEMRDRTLEKLVMSPHIYTYRGDDFCGAHSPDPVAKAKYACKYILSRMSANEYPNLYITKDFRGFRPLTDLAPQKAYNWYTTELIHWTLLDGKPGEGILFKPENFNPRIKYPIIFYYYEKNAFNLNIFIHPDLSQGTMSIPWFVSNGYLVFVPDIYYKMGYPGRSAYNSVVSAALHLSKKPFVDSHKMGLQGHSFGGFETNYIVSHSSLFTAAAPASGITNVISTYGETGVTWFYERRQGRIGASLWQRPDLYLENSVIFSVDKVSASVLIMHTKNDWIVPYSQGLQWYSALHRLGKKVWLLSYNGEDHTLYNNKNRLDYSIRLGQFFDHYLKSAPAPMWMTRGVLPELEEIDDGLKLDMSGKQP